MSRPTCRFINDQRVKAILQAADLFSEQGYDATCKDTIIKPVGGFKRNIDGDFDEKEGAVCRVLVAAATEDIVMKRTHSIQLNSFGDQLRICRKEYGAENLLLVITVPFNETALPYPAPPFDTK